jgi:hypothetical protein
MRRSPFVLSRRFYRGKQGVVMTQVKCEDCGLAYSYFDLDVTLPDDQWLLIHPESEEGILCVKCMVKRASLLPGITAAKMVFK